MSSSSHKYPVGQCDVPGVRKNTVMAYLEHRQNCLDHLQGWNDTSIV